MGAARPAGGGWHRIVVIARRAGGPVTVIRDAQEFDAHQGSRDRT